MPLLGNGEYKYPLLSATKDDVPSAERGVSVPINPAMYGQQSQLSSIAKSAISTSRRSNGDNTHPSEDEASCEKKSQNHPHTRYLDPSSARTGPRKQIVNEPGSTGKALTDTPAPTPAPTAPNSPNILPRRNTSGASSSGRYRAATTLDIPGLTKSRASPDGRIAQKDVGSKLVIIMVGLPARGKSYITKKLARYLNWLQHDTKIFNVGERRRIVATTSPPGPSTSASNNTTSVSQGFEDLDLGSAALNPMLQRHGSSLPGTSSTHQEENLAIDTCTTETSTKLSVDTHLVDSSTGDACTLDTMEHNANFFDPNNEECSKLRERVALWTLDELLDFILEQGGSVGIFDATNSTLERRQTLINRIRLRAGHDLGILFLESVCIDDSLLEANMRLKLSGPDYRDQDPVSALADFKQRVAMYETKYVPLGDYEEQKGISYIKMVDVGRKIISHQIRGFLSAQANYYLLNFNLAPRQIWVTRHGESVDNVKGKIGGDSELTDNGRAYATALTAFMKEQRQNWEAHQRDKALSTHFPPQRGDSTPPNPTYDTNETDTEHPKTFCVWSSMLKRSIQTAEYFDEEEYDLKQMKMLDELNAGIMEGLTYDEIKYKHAAEYALRRQDKLRYRYPGPGGEGYLDITNRLRPVIHEVERMTDHVLLVGHRSVARVLLAYFMGLDREDIADLDVPLGMLYMLEPKPYGVEFKAYRYNVLTQWFDLDPNYELRRATH